LLNQIIRVAMQDRAKLVNIIEQQN